MRNMLLAAALTLLGLPSAALGSGCYLCGTGSAPSCRDYCAYQGADTFDTRHQCQAKGCKISGTSSCPSPPPANVKMCMQGPGRTPLAAIPWCANAQGRS